MKELTVSLDRWLTTHPDEDYDNWCDEAIEAFSDDFFNRNEDWIMDEEGLCSEWLNKLHSTNPNLAAKIIERAYRRYGKDTKTKG